MTDSELKEHVQNALEWSPAWTRATSAFRLIRVS